MKSTKSAQVNSSNNMIWPLPLPWWPARACWTLRNQSFHSHPCPPGIHIHYQYHYLHHLQKAFLCSQLLMLEDRNFHLLNFTWAVIINQSRQWWWQVFSKWKYWRQMKTWRIKPTASPSDIVPPTWRNNQNHWLNSLVLMVSPIFDKSDVKPSWWGIAALSLWRDHLYPRQIAWKPEEGKLCHFERLTSNAWV